MKAFKDLPTPDLGQQALLTEFANNTPEFFLAMSREFGEMVRFRVLLDEVVLVTDPDLVREVIVTRAKEFPKAQKEVDILSRFIGEGLVTTNHGTHKRQRKLSQPAFHKQRIKNYGDVMAEYARIMRDEVQDGQSIDMAEWMMELTMYIVAKTMFDTDMNDISGDAQKIGHAMDEAQNLSDETLGLPFLLPRWIPTRINRRNNRMRRTLDSTINGMVAKRRQEEAAGEPLDRGDLLSMFLMAKDEDGSSLSNVEIREQLITIFAAGHETTSNALTWTYYLLSQNPEVEAKMLAEIDAVLEGRMPTLADLGSLTYTEMVIKESMRLFPPVWVLNSRSPLKKTELGGYAIESNKKIFLSQYAIHRNERYFEEPERFDPERFSPENEPNIPKYAYFPFGGGPRVCIGNSFAMMEAVLIMATIGQRFRFSLDPNQTIDYNARITLSNKTGMKMWAHKRFEDAIGSESRDQVLGLGVAAD